MFVYPHPIHRAVVRTLHIRWYGLMYLVGFLSAGGWLVAVRRPESSWKPLEVDDLIFFLLSHHPGRRLGWMLFYGTERILSEPLSVFRIWEGGMSFHAAWSHARRAGALRAQPQEAAGRRV